MSNATPVFTMLKLTLFVQIVKLICQIALLRFVSTSSFSHAFPHPLPMLSADSFDFVALLEIVILKEIRVECSSIVEMRS